MYGQRNGHGQYERGGPRDRYPQTNERPQNQDQPRAKDDRQDSRLGSERTPEDMYMGSVRDNKPAREDGSTGGGQYDPRDDPYLGRSRDDQYQRGGYSGDYRKGDRNSGLSNPRHSGQDYNYERGVDSRNKQSEPVESYLPNGQRDKYPIPLDNYPDPQGGRQDPRADYQDNRERYSDQRDRQPETLDRMGYAYEPYPDPKDGYPDSRESPRDIPVSAAEMAGEDPYARGGKGPYSNGYARDGYGEPPPQERGHDAPAAFEVDHLATFSVGSRQGLMFPEDGVRRLQNMEQTSGIWTMRCVLVIENSELVILEPRPGSRDKLDGEEMERFPLDLVTDPTAVSPADRGSVYNNILAFTVVEDNRRTASPSSEMHLFQVLHKSAGEVKDEIRMAKARTGRQMPQRMPSNVKDRIAGYENAERAAPAMIDPPYHGQYYAKAAAYQPAGRPSAQFKKSSQDDDASSVSERTDRNVQMLNKCFDDIEKFVARLQSSADAFRELERRRTARGKRNKKEAGDGMLSMRARPPPPRDFIDIFQKFKLAFNLLAKLEAFIHDPNAPELVHFLFTPLSLVVEASKDPRNGAPDLASKVVAPLLSPEAKSLLLHCLTSKEADLWMSLGEAWTIHRDDWKRYVPPYVPRFSDGWEPPASWLDDESQMAAAVHAQQDQIQRRNEREQEIARAEERVMPYPRDNRPYNETAFREERDNRGPPPEENMYGRSLPNPRNQDVQRREEPYPSQEQPPYGYDPYPPRDDPYSRRDEDPYQRRDREPQYPRRGDRRDDRRDDRYYDPRQDPPAAAPISRPPMTWDERNQEFFQVAKSRGAKVAEVTHDRQGRNEKELTVKKGEYLEVLEDAKNWWKTKNMDGLVGHVPYTILQETQGGTLDKPRDVYDPPLDDQLSFASTPSYPVPTYRELDSDPYNQNSQSPRAQASPPQQRVESPGSVQVEPNDVYARVVRKASRDQGRDAMNFQRDTLHAELKESISQPKGRAVQRAASTRQNLHITKESQDGQVLEWLRSRGFHEKTIQKLQSRDGAGLFRYTREDLEKLIGQDEAKRLHGLLTIEKNLSGYKEDEELKQYLDRMKLKHGP